MRTKYRLRDCAAFFATLSGVFLSAPQRTEAFQQPFRTAQPLRTKQNAFAPAERLSTHHFSRRNPRRKLRSSLVGSPIVHSNPAP
jgi:hypothetical protein